MRDSANRKREKVYIERVLIDQDFLGYIYFLSHTSTRESGSLIFFDQGSCVELRAITMGEEYA